jgi:ADP-ribose pyrophosphatase YjhB (NUDIX family)
MVVEMPITNWRVSVKALVRYNGKYLAFKTMAKYMKVPDLPGGGLEINESPFEGIKREIKEETNLDIDTLEYIGNFPFIQLSGIINVAMLFVTEIDDISEIKLEPHISDVEWLTLEEMMRQLPILAAAQSIITNSACKSNGACYGKMRNMQKKRVGDVPIPSKS